MFTAWLSLMNTKRWHSGYPCLLQAVLLDFGGTCSSTFIHTAMCSLRETMWNSCQQAHGSAFSYSNDKSSTIAQHRRRLRLNPDDQCGRSTKTYKGYIVLFVCFSISALHLEAITDYSTAGFLAAFRCFTGRRGICATLTSNCGANHVGSENELRQMFKRSSPRLNSVAALLANAGTKWRFNPPSTPHEGIKSVKFLLRRVIGDHILKYEELATLLVQIEVVLNSWPLCPLSDNPADGTALTSGHFINSSAITTDTEPTLLDLPPSALSRWQLVSRMLKHFESAGHRSTSTEFKPSSRSITEYSVQYEYNNWIICWSLISSKHDKNEIADAEIKIISWLILHCEFLIEAERFTRNC